MTDNKKNESNEKQVSEAGLADVVACNSGISLIDGQAGQLLYRGYDAVELARHSTFEEVAYLLWYGRLPDLFILY